MWLFPNFKPQLPSPKYTELMSEREFVMWHVVFFLKEFNLFVFEGKYVFQLKLLKHLLTDSVLKNCLQGPIIKICSQISKRPLQGEGEQSPYWTFPIILGMYTFLSKTLCSNAYSMSYALKINACALHIFWLEWHLVIVKFEIRNK